MVYIRKTNHYIKLKIKLKVNHLNATSHFRIYKKNFYINYIKK